MAFGPPDMNALLAQLLQQNQQRTATVFQNAESGYGKLGAALGLGLGRLVHGKYDPTQDPQYKSAEALSNLLSGVDTTDPVALQQAAAAADAQGNTAAANNIRQHAQKMEEQRAKIAASNATTRSKDAGTNSNLVSFQRGENTASRLTLPATDSVAIQKLLDMGYIETGALNQGTTKDLGATGKVIDEYTMDNVFTPILEASSMAERNQSAVHLGEQLLTELDTGPGLDTLNSIKAFGDTYLSPLGIDLPNEFLGNKLNPNARDAFGAVTASMAAKAIADQKGNLNKTEFELVLNSAAALGKTTAGNKILFEYNKAANARAFEMERLVQEGLASRDIEGANKKIAALRKQPLLSEAETSRIQKLVKAAPVAPPPKEPEKPSVKKTESAGVTTLTTPGGVVTYKKTK